MLDLCLAPMVLAGYVFLSDVTTQVKKHTLQTTGQGEYLEVMTCRKGFGLDAKASTTGLYALDVRYGAELELGKAWVNLAPFGGISYTDHDVYELPQAVQFSVGAQLQLGYDRYSVGISLWHLSNAGLTAPNIGLNNVVISTGFQF